MTKTATKPIDKHNKKGKNIALKILLIFSILIVSILLAGLTYFSILYNKYNLNTVYGLSPNYHYFVADSFYTMLLGQFGYIGLFLYLIAER